MKKIAMYRRGRGCPNDGLKEKIIYQLSGCPMTGRQLAEKLSVEPKIIFINLSEESLRKNKVVKIDAGEWFKNDRGEKDREYRLNRKPRRVAAKAIPEKTIVVSMKSLAERGEDKRQVCVEAAARRARLMRAGLYITGI